MVDKPDTLTFLEERESRVAVSHTLDPTRRAYTFIATSGPATVKFHFTEKEVAQRGFDSIEKEMRIRAINEEDGLARERKPLTSERKSVCAKCQYFAKDTVREGIGYCHRYAPHPRVLPTDTEVSLVWPLVNASSWCGEFA